MKKYKYPFIIKVGTGGLILNQSFKTLQDALVFGVKNYKPDSVWVVRKLPDEKIKNLPKKIKN